MGPSPLDHRGRIPDEKTSGHETSPPSHTRTRKQGVEDPRTNGHLRLDCSKINPSLWSLFEGRIRELQKIVYECRCMMLSASVLVVPPSRSVAFDPVPWTTRLVQCVTVCQCFFEPRSGVSGCARARVCVVLRNVYRAATIKLRTFVPVIDSGYRIICTPSPRTVSVLREGSRRATSSPMTLLRCGNPIGFHGLRAVDTPVPSGRLDEAYIAYGLKSQEP
ncbi:hypothetical protein EVAR_54878_1 [Eumeta japonica]|uniref:Uncharacterized protein n=1 Tax=Eumeta variegata TaxID=151549 RepID=A0A4C1YCK6_EUMVA|nr:hypothetical protein EVAR_54878_1 [Eumeta japonica]